jgi:ribonuclease HI
MKPITIKIEEIVKQYEFKIRQHQDLYLDHKVQHCHWPHPAAAVPIHEIETTEESTISAYTDASKSEEGIGTGTVLTMEVTQFLVLLKLKESCSNNQAEPLAIYKALEMIKPLHKDCFNPHTAIIYTDSRVAINSIHNTNHHSYLAEEIRKIVANLDRREWKANFLGLRLMPAYWAMRRQTG